MVYIEYMWSIKASLAACELLSFAYLDSDSNSEVYLMSPLSSHCDRILYQYLLKHYLHPLPDEVLINLLFHFQRILNAALSLACYELYNMPGG